jgi:secreted Zn-dependent insulinase-like peptidase
MRRVDHLTMTKLIIKIIREQLENVIYKINKLDYDLELYVNNNGIQIQLKGFSDSLSDILHTFMQKITNPDWNLAKFNKLKSLMIKAVDQDHTEQPVHKLSYTLNQILEGNLYTN